ncbi:MAG: patatin-like phospholipase family protein [Planctomycetota bacterium]|nr:patatin-like phospholipase family protein [Planctomycetota bacterium]
MKQRTDNDRAIQLALGGGAARGMAHIGVLHALEEAGLTIAGTAGTSIGSVVGGLHAAGVLDEYEEVMLGLDRQGILALLDPGLPTSGLFAGARMEALLRSIAGPVHLEELEIEFLAVAVELVSGREVWLRDGELVAAIRASSSIPGMFKPVRRDQVWLVDGGLAAPVPVRAARALGPHPVVAVNLIHVGLGEPHVEPVPAEEGAAPEAGADDRADTEASVLGRLVNSERISPQVREFFSGLAKGGEVAAETVTRGAHRFRRRVESAFTPGSPGLFDALYTSAVLFQHHLAATTMELHMPELLIEPRLDGVGLFDFHRAAELIAEGERAAREALETQAGQRLLNGN